MSVAFSYGDGACAGKKGYPSAHDAHTALRNVNTRKTRHSRGAKLNAYRCPACALWHLGNTNHTVNKR